MSNWVAIGPENGEFELTTYRVVGLRAVWFNGDEVVEEGGVFSSVSDAIEWGKARSPRVRVRLRENQVPLMVVDDRLESDVELLSLLSADAEVLSLEQAEQVLLEEMASPIECGDSSAPLRAEEVRRLRDLRMRAGMDLEEVAHRSGVPIDVVERMESEDGEYVRDLNQWLKVARLFVPERMKAPQRVRAVLLEGTFLEFALARLRGD